MKISVIVPVMNCVEEVPIFLNNLSFADEIIIINGGCWDGTIEEIKKYDLPIKIVNRYFDKDWCAMWDFGERWFATGDWILWWGSDEAAPKRFSQNIKPFLEKLSGDIDYVRFGIMDLINDEEHYLQTERCMFGMLWVPHLFRRGNACCKPMPDETEDLQWDRSKCIAFPAIGIIHYKFLSEKRLRRKMPWCDKSLPFDEVVKSGLLSTPGIGNDIKCGVPFERLIVEIPEYIKWNKIGKKGLSELRL